MTISSEVPQANLVVPVALCRKRRQESWSLRTELGTPRDHFIL